MLLIKKIIIVVAILLVSVFGLSFVSRSIELIKGDSGSVSDDGHTGIGLASAGMELVNKPKPVFNKFSNVPDSHLNLFSTDGSCITYDPRDYNDYYESSYALSGKEYVRMLFYDNNYIGISLSEYTHLKIAFDIYNPYPESDGSLLNCDVALFGRNSDDQINNAYFSVIKLSLNEQSGMISCRLRSGEVLYDQRFHVEYVLAINPANYNESRMQVFVNNMLYEDSVYSDVDLFVADPIIDKLIGVDITKFSASSSFGFIGFSNLIVTGYNVKG